MTVASIFCRSRSAADSLHDG